MVSCPRCTCPSIHVETLKITVGCPPCTYPSIHLSPGAGTQDHGRLPDIAQKLAHVLDSLVASLLVLMFVCVVIVDTHQRPERHAHRGLYQCCTRSQSAQDCASFASSPRNPNRTTLRSSPHARRPSIVDTSKTKAQLSERASILCSFKKTTSVITEKCPARNFSTTL